MAVRWESKLSFPDVVANIFTENVAFFFKNILICIQNEIQKQKLQYVIAKTGRLEFLKF